MRNTGEMTATDVDAFADQFIKTNLSILESLKSFEELMDKETVLDFITGADENKADWLFKIIADEINKKTRDALMDPERYQSYSEVFSFITEQLTVKAEDETTGETIT